MIRFLLAAVLGVAAGLWEAGAQPFLPPWASIEPLLIGTVLFLVLSSRSRALTFVIPGALILEAYRLFAFDLPLLRWIMIVFILDAVAQQFLTNRSVYATVSLAVFARILDWASAWGLALIGRWLDFSPYGWTLPEGWLWTLGWDVLLVALGFLAVAAFGRRLRPGSRQDIHFI